MRRQSRLRETAARALRRVRAGDEQALLQWTIHGEQGIPATPRQRLNRLKRWWRLAQVLEVMRPGDRVWDAGCGTGTDALLFAVLRGVRVRGSDVQPGRIAEANRRRRKWKELFHPGEGLVSPFIAENVHRSSHPDAAFDLVWCNQAIEHIEPPEEFLGECARVLRPGGILAIGNMNGRNPYIRWKAARDRGAKPVVGEVADPRTGEAVAYANEKVRRPAALAAMAAEAGFASTEVRHFGCVPSPLAVVHPLVRPLFGVDGLLSATPLAPVLAQDFVLLARR